jgi:hypothetical protein
MATGYPVTVLGEEAALPRQGTANAWGDEQEPSQAGLVGGALSDGRPYPDLLPSMILELRNHSNIYE